MVGPGVLAPLAVVADTEFGEEFETVSSNTEFLLLVGEDSDNGLLGGEVRTVE